MKGIVALFTAIYIIPPILQVVVIATAETNSSSCITERSPNFGSFVCLVLDDLSMFVVGLAPREYLLERVKAYTNNI